jgi:EAL domain-containing protein (putative c-di-GMP-specific phosphodiesterase class I)/CheY-like chemotaxis protein
LDAIRLLIADDDLPFIDSLVKILTLEPGVEIVGIANDAKEAVRLAVQLQPDVALCDVNMPGGGGPVACVGIRESAPTTRVIAHSMYDDRGAVMHMVRAGAIGYVLKGSRREQIVSALERARNGEASLSGHVASLVVSELAAHLRDQEREAERKRQDLAAVRRLAGGEGLELRFEPIVDLVLETMVGVEAIPWRPSPTGVEGGDFESWQATAASVGFGAELDLVVARLGLAQVAHFPPGVWIGINVAPSTLLDPTFAESLLSNSEAMVCLEVGDHPMTDYGDLRRRLDQVRGPNVKVAVDGVGSSGAALRQLVELEPDLVKLDSWVLRRNPGKSDTFALVETMARLVASMGCQLIACGVNDQSEMQTLRDAGVRFAQGENAAALVAAPTLGPQGAPGEPPLRIAR